jgi:dihydroxyacid dehydratase/phosphogluconate dehydratase
LNDTKKAASQSCGGSCVVVAAPHFIEPEIQDSMHKFPLQFPEFFKIYSKFGPWPRDCRTLGTADANATLLQQVFGLHLPDPAYFDSCWQSNPQYFRTK